MDFGQATTKLRELQRRLVGSSRRKRIDLLFARLAVDPKPERIAVLCARVEQMDPFNGWMQDVDKLCNELQIPQTKR